MLENVGHSLTVCIPESKYIDGGRPFVNICIKAGYNIILIPNASNLQALKRCKATFIGVEAF